MPLVVVARLSCFVTLIVLLALVVVVNTLVGVVSLFFGTEVSDD